MPNESVQFHVVYGIKFIQLPWLCSLCLKQILINLLVTSLHLLGAVHCVHCLQRKDLLQLMIDASDSETQKGLEKGEIIADSVGFMLAGYETTSTALAFATYLLATNPEVQERLANEIHEYFEENPVSVMQCSFMYEYINFCVATIL